MALRVTVDGTDRTADVVARSIRITDTLNDLVSTCAFEMKIYASRMTVDNGSTVLIEKLQGAQVVHRYFSGTIISNERNKIGPDASLWRFTCADDRFFLKSASISARYTDMTAGAILEDILSKSGTGITTQESDFAFYRKKIQSVNFENVPADIAINQVATSLGGAWYVDTEKKFFMQHLSHGQTFSISEPGSSATQIQYPYKSMSVMSDTSQIRNSVEARHRYEVENGRVAIRHAEVGRVHGVGDYDGYSGYDPGVTFLTDTVGITIPNYRGNNRDLSRGGLDYDAENRRVWISNDDLRGARTRDIDIIYIRGHFVDFLSYTAEDTESQRIYGKRSKIINATSATSFNDVFDIATRELVEYSSPLLKIKFKTYESEKVHVGMNILFDIPSLGIDGVSAFVQSVTVRFRDNDGDMPVSDVSLYETKDIESLEYFTRALNPDDFGGADFQDDNLVGLNALSIQDDISVSGTATTRSV